MTEYPLFLPFNGERLASVLTVPDDDPRALVLLLQGMGSPRSHKYRLWTRAARELAGRGLASLRFDYEELGDSTGSFVAELDNPPIEEALAALHVTARQLGTHVLGVVGNCMGARAALGVAGRLHGCRFAVCILPGNLEAIIMNEPLYEGLLGAEPGGLDGSASMMHEAGLAYDQRPEFAADFLTAIEETETLLLCLGSSAVHERLRRTMSFLPRSGAPHVHTRFLATPPMTQFRLDIPTQELVIHSIVDWIDERSGIAGGAAALIEQGVGNE